MYVYVLCTILYDYVTQRCKLQQLSTRVLDKVHVISGHDINKIMLSIYHYVNTFNVNI